MGTVPIWKQWLIIAAGILLGPMFVFGLNLTSSVVTGSPL